MTGRALVTAGALVVAVVAATPTSAVQQPVTTKTVTVQIAGRSFPAQLSYPARQGRYPVVAFAHGYMNRSSWYAETLRSIAAWGYVVIAPDSETGRFPSHARLAGDLNRSLRWLSAQSATGTHNVPRGRVDATRFAVAGHSMGGGVALLAATRNRSVDTVFTLAAAETRPRASLAVRGLRVPSLFVVGSDDRIVPAAGTAVMFRRAPSPTLLASITGGSHCGFMEVIPVGCDAGWISYDRQLRLTRDADSALARAASPREEVDSRHRPARHPLRRWIKRPYKCQVLRPRKATGLDVETLSYPDNGVKGSERRTSRKLR